MTIGFARFNKQFASTGNVTPLTDAQANAGWAFLGTSPPTVEEFNAMMQSFDDKDNWLYGNIATLATNAGVAAPADGDFTTLYKAIASLAVSGIAPVTMAGTATAYTLANTLPLTAYVNGQRIRGKVNATNTGAATLKVDTLAAIPIFGLGGVALQGGEMPANSIATFEITISASLNGGSAIAVLQEAVGGPSQVATATQAQHAVPLAQMQAAQGSYSGFTTLANNATLTAANLGTILQVGGSNTTNMIATSALSAGQGFMFTNTSSATASNIVVASGSGDLFYFGTTSTATLALPPGQTCFVWKTAAGVWRVEGLVTANYVTLPVIALNSSGPVNGVVNPNLSFNGSGEMGSVGWTLTTPFAQAFDTTGGIGTFFSNTSALASVGFQEFGPIVSIGPAKAVTWSARIANFATAGTIQGRLTAYTSAGVFIADIATLVITNGVALTTYTKSDTTPANTAYVRWNFWCGSGCTAAAFGLVWQAVKVEVGSVATLPSTDASVSAALAGLAQVGAMVNGNVKLNGASKTFTFTADEITVGSALGGQKFTLNNVSATINTATTGLGGMNTGTPTVSGFVGVYLVYNPTASPAGSAYGLIAVNEASTILPMVTNAASIPAGYTASCLLGVYWTDASGNFQGFYQVNRRVYNGGASSYNAVGAQTLLGVQLANIPTTATKWSGGMSITNNAAAVDTATIYPWTNGGPGSQGGTRNLSGAGALSITIADMSIDRKNTPRAFYITISTSAGTCSVTVSALSYEI
jgi:hypothetical protein